MQHPASIGGASRHPKRLVFSRPFSASLSATLRKAVNPSWTLHAPSYRTVRYSPPASNSSLREGGCGRRLHHFAKHASLMFCFAHAKLATMHRASAREPRPSFPLSTFYLRLPLFAPSPSHPPSILSLSTLPTPLLQNVRVLYWI